MIPTIAYKPSKVYPLIYFGYMFTRIGYDGDVGDLVREYGIGQHKDGYWGHYTASIIIPKSWKFCKLSDDAQNKVAEPYGGVFYDRTTHLSFADSYVLKWDFQKGGDCEKYIGEEDVLRDINEVIKAIVKYEIEEDFEIFAHSFYQVYIPMNDLFIVIREKLCRGSDEGDNEDA